TLFLLTESVATARDALRERLRGEASLRQLALSPAAGIEGLLFMHRPTASEPDWADPLRAYVPGLPNLNRKRASAVLVLNTANRWLAVTFGHGRLLIDQAKIERNFGLKVVVNSVEADSLRSVDARSLEELSLATSSRIGRGVAISNFGIDLERDIILLMIRPPP